MKKLLTILCLVLLVSCSPPPEVPYDKLVERQGITYEINSTTPFTGSSIDYYSNGQLESRGTFKDGKMDGLLETYHENGQLRERRNYKDGKFDGLSESFYRNGQLESRENYKEGKKEGLHMSYPYGNSQLGWKGNYKNGEQDGLQEYFWNGRLLKSYEYKDGVRLKCTGLC